MDWKNSEQFPDFTAGEAMSRVMLRDPEGADALDGGGCRLLADAVILQAVRDYAEVLQARSRGSRFADRRLELEAFFRSDYFRLLSGMEGTRLMRIIRREVKAE